jgi:hypothetical protein
MVGRIFMSATFALGLSACATAPAIETRAGDVDPATNRWSGRLLPRAQPPLAASVVMSPVNGTNETVAVISVQGAPQSARGPLAWRVYHGSCEGAPSVFGSAADYPVLALRADGTGQATATIRQPTPTSGIFHARLHPSPTRLGEVLACGTLQLGAM